MVYVMLEFCLYYGKIFLCVEVLIVVGIVCVVVVIIDFDLCVVGCGLVMLKVVGIEVIEGICKVEVDCDYVGFFF